MALDKDSASAENSEQDPQDGQAETGLTQPAAIPNADEGPGGQPQPPSLQQLDQGQNLEADVEDDADSALGIDDDDRSISTALSASMREYLVENGRTYHNYHGGQYPYPNDEAEQDRLDLQHHLYELTLDNRLYLAPIKKDVQNVLDVGTGTGLWAIDFADDHPSAVVIGIDLSPIQPTSIPPNLKFMVDDANDTWVYKHKFDYIHARELHCVLDERRLMDQALENLEPGGWFEMQELGLPVRSDDGTSSPNDAIYRWSELMIQATSMQNQSLDKPQNYAQWMRDAGFANVTCQIFSWPLNTWPKDRKLKEIGLWSLANALNGLEGFTMAYFTRYLGWSPQEVQVFLVDVRKDLRDRSKHYYNPIYITYGQKPE